MSKISKEQDEIWRKDPKNWKWGIFYYNKEDDRILPPKCNPAMGVTVNFANRRSVLFFILLISIPLSIPIIFLLIEFFGRK